MEESDKYYVPDITQLFIGYSCEVLHSFHPKLGTVGEWKQVKIGDIGQGNDIIPITRFRSLKKQNRIRTKYLDTDDVKSLGWKEISNNYFTKDDYYLFIGYNNNIIHLYYLDVDNNEVYLFTGTILSVNELKKIFKFVGI